jgi:integrase
LPLKRLPYLRQLGRLYAQKRSRPDSQKIVLLLPDLDHAKASALNSLSSPQSRRNYRFAMIPILPGCGLRRAELAALNIDDIQIRQEHRAIVDLVGKGGHVRTPPMPAWVKDSVDQWLAAADLKHGRIFRAVSRHGSWWGQGI